MTHRITRDDLDALTYAIIGVMERHSSICNDATTRSNLNTAKRILDYTRWNGGPYLEVTEAKTEEQ